MQDFSEYSDYPVQPLGASIKVSELDLSDRPREKALASGITSLTNAELVAIILGSGTPGQSVIDLAKAMLAAEGNKLTRLARASVDELVKRHKGVGPAKAINLLAALQLGLRCCNETAEPEPQFKSSIDIFRFMQSRVGMISHEEFWILLTGNSNRIRKAILISRGGITATVVDIRMIMRHALINSCVGMVLVHNHPSGNLRPSREDDNLTKRVVDAAKLFDIRVLDHLIISGNEYYSYSDVGRMPS
ncbi:MAG: DNA repair protein RadC [Muribaculaceae bacterium]|nr:DNA repair protein RadC [Muribaculaceae bacterium]